MCAKKKKNRWLRKIAFLPAGFIAFGLLICSLIRYISPDILFFPSLFGLAFPILLLLGLGLAVLYLIFLRWEFLLFSICISLNYNNIGILIQGKGKPEPLPSEWIAPHRLKLMSYNVRLFNFYGEIPEAKGDIKSQLLDYIKDQDADIVCLQEYYESKNNSFSLGNTFSKAGYIHHTRPASNKNFHYGNIIYSKYPILQEGSLSGMSTFDLVFADLLVGRDTLRVYNMHLESNRFDKTDLAFFEAVRATSNASVNPEQNYTHGAKRMLGKMKRATVKRCQQIKQILLHIPSTKAPSRILLCGDMNDQPLSYAYSRIRRAGFKDAFIEAGSGFGRSYRGYYPSYRIDYIFHKGNLNVLFFDTHAVSYSDHKPLTAIVSLR